MFWVIEKIDSHLLQYSWWVNKGLFDWFSASLAKSLASDTFKANSFKLHFISGSIRCGTCCSKGTIRIPGSLPSHLPTGRTCSLFCLYRPSRHKTSCLSHLLCTLSGTAKLDLEKHMWHYCYSGEALRASLALKGEVLYCKEAGY